MKNCATQKNCKKSVYWILSVLVIMTAAIMYFGVIRHHHLGFNSANVKIDGVFLSQAKPVSDFKLTDHNGNSFTNDNLKGRWTMLFFGFTNCGMVCPTTMAALNEMYTSLEKDLPANKLPQVVLVSVDPERDTVERLSEYVTSFNSHFVGARAEMSETVALEKQLSIAAVKMEADGKGKDHYSINHSAEILLFNPDGKLQAYMSFPHKPDQMIKDYKLILTTEV